MTGPEHYRLAEAAIESAKYTEVGSNEERFYLAIAQVHATLATAAATVLATVADPAADHEAEVWMSTISAEPVFTDAGGGYAVSFDDCLSEQLDGTACIVCAQDFAEAEATRPTRMGPRGQLFAHSDPTVCGAAENDAFADGYVAALDDARVASGRETLLECPEHGAAYYAGRECPACAMDAAVAAWAAENGGAA